MAPQDRSFKYIGSLTEGPSLTSGCGMACCPWTAYACKERTTLKRVSQSHRRCSLISARLLSSACHSNQDRTPENCVNNQKGFWTKRAHFQGNIYLTTCKDYRGAWGFGSVRDGHSLWWRLSKKKEKNWVAAHFQQCWSSVTETWGSTSSITTQICLTHSMMDCGVPAMVMARSVELGSMSPATCTWAPADCKDIATWQSYVMAVTSKIWTFFDPCDATDLSDFLDFAATFANEWATLTGRHDEANGDRWFAGGRTVSHWGAYVLDRKREEKIKCKWQFCFYLLA